MMKRYPDGSILVMGDVSVDRDTGAIIATVDAGRFLCAACGKVLAPVGESVCGGCRGEMMAGGPAWDERPVVWW